MSLKQALLPGCCRPIPSVPM